MGGREARVVVRVDPPLTPDEKRPRSLILRIDAVAVRGPLAENHWVPAPNHDRFFPEPVPADPAGRLNLARKLLADFATRAFRRPVEPETADRLAKLAEDHYSRDGRTFEAGVARAMTVVLASPRFLYREEGTLPGPAGVHPLVDEYALAGRLSYFLWSTMPDEELFRLARDGRLRADLPAQLGRMLKGPRAGEFVRNFVGQWLQARGVDGVRINGPAVAAGDGPPDPAAQRQRARSRELARKPAADLSPAEREELDDARAKFSGGFRRFELTPQLRRDMRRETEMLFEYVVRDDRSLLELLDRDYTFLYERLAGHYGIPGVSGEPRRLVKLPAGSPRGGVLTQGTVLAVTSNPDRTSPVKRGLFVLENILGTPPPSDIPALEEAATAGGKRLTVREAMAAHRSQASCRSCHARMDPLGLAFENFNALGVWRDRERDGAIDAAGELATGEAFPDSGSTRGPPTCGPGCRSTR